MSRPRLLIAFASIALVVMAGTACGQDSGVDDSADFEKQSVALRTALHYDPSLGQPLKALLQLYEKAERSEELLGLYRAHIAEYPDDAGAHVVLIRLLQMLNRAESGEMIQSAVRQHPGEPMLHYLLYESYRKADDERTLTTLSKAIELQAHPDRRDIWLDELLELGRARGEDSGEAKQHLIALRDAAGKDTGALLAVAQRMHRYDFNDGAVETLVLAENSSPDPESGVEIQVLRAKVEASLGDKPAAAKRIVAVLDTLAPDHWRRRELTNLRLQLAGSDAERNALLSTAKDRHENAKGPSREAAALDYAGLLSVAGQRRKAADVLMKASEAIPPSARLEAAVLDVLDRIGDEQGLLEYLESRVELQAERDDLRYRLTKSQYLAGENDAAQVNLETVLATLEEEEKIERILDMARYLRKASLSKPSITLLNRVAEAWPKRLDVRRELAEALVAIDDRPKAAALLHDSDFATAEIENFLDLIQFMMAGKFHVEARDALETRLAIDPDQFELKLLLVEVLGQTGERQPGEKLLVEAKTLADTSTRYRRWLDVSFAFYDLFDDAAMFFDREQYAFIEPGGDTATAGEWSADRAERFLGLIEVGAEGRLDLRVTQALRNQLAQPDLPADLELRLRMLLVKALEKSPENAVEVEQQLTQLAAADSANAAEYDLRRALLYHAAQRPDLAQELLGGIDLITISDESVLRASYVMFLDYSLIDTAVACVERLAILEPADLVNAQRQLSLYAALGLEIDLRRSLRRLLAGVDKVDFDADTLAVLRGHLLDSYWRSISVKLDEDDAIVVTEIDALLDEVEREALSGADRLWVFWVRAYLLNRSGQTEGRDAVFAELENAVAEEGAAAQIVFPDGLATTLDAARAMLSDDPVADDSGSSSDDGPLRELTMSWGFECEPGAVLTQIEPVPGSELLLALDDRGTVYCIDAATGKLAWREKFIFPSSRVATNAAAISRTRGTSISLNQGIEKVAASEIQLAMQLLVDGGGRFYLPIDNGIRCHAASDGHLLWETDLSLGVAAPPWSATHDLRLARPTLQLSIEGDRLLAFSPAIGVAASLDAESGKLVWLRTLAAPGANVVASSAKVASPVFSLNSGAAFGEGKMLAFGAQSEILDTATGSTLWSLGLEAPRRFPVQLRAADPDHAEDESKPEDTDDEEDAKSMANFLGGAIQLGLQAASINHRADESARYAAAAKFVQYSGTLLAPAAHWAQGRPGSGVPHDALILGDELLLMGQELHSISLSLPLGSIQLPAETAGTWIGLAGSSAWMLHVDELHRLELERGGDETISMAEVSGEAGIGSVIMSGARVYVVGDGGVLVLNAYSGTPITKLEWPEALDSYRQSIAGEWADQVPLRRLWQGGVYGGSGRPMTCIDDRLRMKVDGKRIYVTVNNSSFVALDEAAAETEPEAAKPGDEK